MKDLPMEDRIAGAVLGLFIGDALGVGPHWYYDLDKLHEDYGEYITDYSAPKPGRYHEGLQAGDVSQTGQVAQMLLESATEKNGYDRKDFTARLDGLLNTLDGTPHSGRYTDDAMRWVWRARKQENKPWDQAGGWSDTAEGAIRAPILAGRYAHDPGKAMEAMVDNVMLTHKDPFILGQSVGFGLVVLAALHGAPFEKTAAFIRAELKKAGKKLEVPTPVEGETAPFIDVLMQPMWSKQASHDPAVRLQPPHHACRLFGMACTLTFMLPAAFYFNARFSDDFEEAVLSAVNGGGNNMARAALTGALAGARQGLSGIPERFLTGLTDGNRLTQLARDMAASAAQ